MEDGMEESHTMGELETESMRGNDLLDRKRTKFFMIKLLGGPLGLDIL